VGEFEERTHIKPPEMTYFENYLRFHHLPSGLVLILNAEDALLKCRKTQEPQASTQSDAEVKGDAAVTGTKEAGTLDSSPELSAASSQTSENPEGAPTKQGEADTRQGPETHKSSTGENTKDQASSSQVATSQGSSGLISKTTHPSVQVKVAAAWKSLVERMGMKQIETIYDWTYTTTYNGEFKYIPPESTKILSERVDGKIEKVETKVPQLHPAAHKLMLAHPKPQPQTHAKFEPTTQKIDYELLMRRDPILYSQEIVLYEDELHDNGVSKLYVKLRVMPYCFFVLMRLWVRVDYVVIRMKDYRFFHRFDSHHVLRETRIYEATMDDLDQMGLPFAVSPCWRNPDEAAQKLPVKEQFTEILYLNEKM